ncbi:MAG: hypothetical protein K2Q25_10690 [Mycobacteriaceae bacterium]|nr:hypothetical protein [Mycobacteriaceae bacterium]
MPRLGRTARSRLAMRSVPSREDRHWPGYLFGGHVRTSTVVLIMVFMVLWWAYDTYRPQPAPGPPAVQVVPPGFVPDPNYTWVPRTEVQQPQTITVTVQPTATLTITPSPTTVTTTNPPPPPLPFLPPLVLPPPLGPPSTTPMPSPSG